MSAPRIVEEGDPEWESLKKLWEAERRPGYVCGRGGTTYRVLHPEDDIVKFVMLNDVDDLYASRSTGALAP